MIFYTMILPWLIYAFGFAESRKPHDLELLMVAPLSGRIVPMGDACLKPLEYSLSILNNQSEILPDYHVTVAVIDDECSGAVVLPRLIHEYDFVYSNTSRKSKWRYPISSDSNSIENSKKVVKPPILLGGLCSSVCKAASKLNRIYEMLEIAIGCSSPDLYNEKMHPNFFRFYRTGDDYAFNELRLMSLLGFTKVGMVSDTLQNNFYTSVQFMKIVYESGNEIYGEFFQSDPAEAISRLIANDIRIVFVHCYRNICPIVACTAFKANYYGPNVVWIFQTQINLVNPNLEDLPGCTQQMIDKITDSAIFVGPDLTAKISYDMNNEFGISVQSLDAYMKSNYLSIYKSPAYGWSLGCPELLFNAVMLLDRVNKDLKAKGTSLVDAMKSGPGEMLHLLERKIEETTFNSVYGPGMFYANVSYGSTVRKRAYSSPRVVMLQLQNKKMVIIGMENTSKGIGAVEYVNNEHFVWKTKDGSAPRSTPEITKVTLNFPKVVPIIFLIFSILLGIGVVISIVLLVKHRKSLVFVNTLPYMNILIISGPMLSLAVIVLFPIQDINSFCKVKIFLESIGSSLLFGGLAIKLSLGVFFSPLVAISYVKTVQNAAFISLAIWIFITVTLLIVNQSIQDFPPHGITVQKLANDGNGEQFPQKLSFEIWEMCFESFISWIITGLHAAIAIIGIVFSMIMRNTRQGVYISDIATCQNCLYIIFPIWAGLMMIRVTIDYFAMPYIAMVINSFSQSVVLSIWLVAYKIRYREALEREERAKFAKIKNKQTNRATKAYRFRREVL